MSNSPKQHCLDINGTRLNLYEWEGDGPPLLFVHANGLHARCWDQVIKYLPEFHCFAIELRSHGLSDITLPPFDWRIYIEDIIQLFHTLDLEQMVGVGHSFGGFLLALAAARHDLFKKLILIDPLMPSPEFARFYENWQGEHPCRNRQHLWPSSEAFLEKLKDRPPFKDWDPKVLCDYTLHGLKKNTESDNYVLACPPEVEGALFEELEMSSIYTYVKRIKSPVVLVRGREKASNDFSMDFSMSTTWPGSVDHFQDCKDIYLPQQSHFIPMEIPEKVADIIRDSVV